MPLSVFPLFVSVRHRLAGLCLFFLLLMLAACSDEQGQNQKNATQIAASVNGVEITQHEVDLLYRLSNPSDTPVPAEVTAARRRAILADLVRTEALAQEAVTRKLDATPDLMVEEHMARRKALAQLVERQTLRTTTGVDAQAVKNFVKDTPYSFAERQLLTLEEMALITPDEALFSKLDTAASQGANLERLEQMVREAKGSVQRKLFSAGTEEISPAVAKSLLAAKPGTPVVVQNTPNRGSVLLVRSAIPAPLVGEAANQAAAAMINAQLRQQASQQMASKVVGATKITYYGEFSPAAIAAAKGATAKASQVQQDELPKGAYQPEKKNKGLRIAIVVAAVCASALAVLMLVSARRYWRSELSRPLGKVVLGLMMFVLLGLLGWQLFGASYWLARWTVGGSLVGGVVLGVVVNWLLMRSTLQKKIAEMPGLAAAACVLLQLATSLVGLFLA